MMNRWGMSYSRSSCSLVSYIPLLVVVLALQTRTAAFQPSSPIHQSRSGSTFLSSPAADGNTRDRDSRDGPPAAGKQGSGGAVVALRFLGKGDRAVVRPGVVLLAPTHEYHHYYRRAAIFVHAMGEGDDGVYVIRGVILDHPTPFTLNEMMPGGKIADNPLKDNLMFRGGDKGGDGVILLHNRENLGQSAIGLSGVYQGGWDAALEACAKGDADVGDFKTFFNYCEFTEPELEDLLKSNEDGDCWASVEVDSGIVLSEDWDRGDCWKRLRNEVAQHMRAQA
jgi:hypothetical protein